MIEIQGLCVEKQDSAICVVRELRCQPGDRTLIHGANGSGKSTLLRVLAGLERGFSGQCKIAAPVRDRVFLHQSPWLFRGTVLSNAMYGLVARGERVRPAKQAAMRWLELFNVAHLATANGKELSGGERRRVALARAFVLEPRLLLLDEPMSDLDDQGEKELRRAIETATRSTIVITSPRHDGPLSSFPFTQQHSMELPDQKYPKC